MTPRNFDVPIRAGANDAQRAEKHAAAVLGRLRGSHGRTTSSASARPESHPARVAAAVGRKNAPAALA